MAYIRITPLPANYEELEVSELRGLETVWRDRKAELEASGHLELFLSRIKRDWAIETGIIERLYEWERGVTEVLIEHGVSASLIAHGSGLDRHEAEHARRLIDDHLEIVDWMFELIKGERPLSQHEIRSIHQAFTRHQDTTHAVTPAGQRVQIPLASGSYKTRPNNPSRPGEGVIHEYCPPELVEDEMTRLLEWHAQHETVPPEIAAAWIHHRFAQIHPFQDGNGRVARTLATIVFLRAGLFPLVVRKQDHQYIELLERADQGDLGPLVAFFAERQKELVLGALAAEHEVRRSRQLDEIISATIGALAGQAKQHEQELTRVFELAAALVEVTRGELESLSHQLDSQLTQVRPADATWNSNVRASDPGSPNSRWFYEQVVSIAKDLQYWANFEPYRGWVRLGIRTEDVFYLVVSFHGHGRVFRGILCASAFTFRRINDDEGSTRVVDVTPAQQLFQFNYPEPRELVERRFREWLSAALTIALEQWRRSVA